MAKSNTTTEVEKPTVVTEGGVIPFQGKPVSTDIVAQMLKKMKQGAEMVSGYKDWVEGEPVRVAVLGVNKLPKIGGQPGEKVNAIRMLTEDNEMIISADAQVVSTLIDNAQLTQDAPESEKNIKCFLIVQTGSTKNKQGLDYKTFSIKPLN